MPCSLDPILAVIPARGGSKGLPGKNTRLLGGLPLIGHAIKFAKACSAIDTTIVSTDSSEIAEVAKSSGGDVPFLRSAELARDDTPMWPVLQHALREMESRSGKRFGSLLLLDVTSPGRLPEDVAAAIDALAEKADADGVVGVSEYEHSPYWYGVVSRDGWMEDLFPEAKAITRRQDVPPVYAINGMIYLWRRNFVLEYENWREGKMLALPLPRERAVNIDTIEDFELAEFLLAKGRLPVGRV